MGCGLGWDSSSWVSLMRLFSCGAFNCTFELNSDFLGPSQKESMRWPVELRWLMVSSSSKLMHSDELELLSLPNFSKKFQNISLSFLLSFLESTRSGKRSKMGTSKPASELSFLLYSVVLMVSSEVLEMWVMETSASLSLLKRECSSIAESQRKWVEDLRLLWVPFLS